MTIATITQSLTIAGVALIAKSVLGTVGSNLALTEIQTKTPLRRGFCYSRPSTGIIENQSGKNTLVFAP